MSGPAVARAAPPVSGASSGMGAADGLALTPVDRERVLPVAAELADLLPWGGLRRGSTVVVRGSTTLLLALLAAASASGSWTAVVGMPDLGVVAAAELGIEVRRLALVPRPGDQVTAVTAALLDGMDLVVVPGGGRVDAARARRLSARARHRGAVLIPFGPWPGADVELFCTGSRWSGLGEGHGHLVARRAVVHARGRGSATKPLRAQLLLPGQGGSLAASVDAGDDQVATLRVAPLDTAG